MTQAQSDLCLLDILACETKATQEAVINGKLFSVCVHIVNRKCYDNLPTPTVMFKVDGKRISRKAAYELLA